MDKKAPLGARKTSLLAGGAPYRLTGDPSWAKKGAFSAKRARLLAEGASIYLKNAVMCERGTSSCQMGAFAGGRGAVLT